MNINLTLNLGDDEELKAILKSKIIKAAKNLDDEVISKSVEKVLSDEIKECISNENEITDTIVESVSNYIDKVLKDKLKF